jgi:hypothetical protein
VPQHPEGKRLEVIKEQMSRIHPFALYIVHKMSIKETKFPTYLFTQGRDDYGIEGIFYDRYPNVSTIT